MGKTREVDVAVRATQTQVLETDSTDVVCKYDLREYGSEADLRDEIFGSAEFQTWLDGTHKLHLFLDSLDECRLRVRGVAQLLVRKLRECPIERLYLRISCRTAEWPKYLETELHTLCGQNDTLRQEWGSTENGTNSAGRSASRLALGESNGVGLPKDEKAGALRVFALVPLMRQDVISAAYVFNLDTDSFVAEVIRKDVVPLAVQPLTLKFLLESYTKNGSFAATRAELYAEGCYRLCEEINLSRLASDLTGNLLPEQRLAVASRIAAVTTFCNRYAVWTGTSADTNPDENDDVAVRELYGGSELANDQSFDVAQDGIKETLNTGLFSSRGPQRMGWAHQTYAEYLAAHYLLQHNVSMEQIMELLTQPTDPDGRLVPQLHETAAWLATMSAPIFTRLMAVDPVVLLRTDVASISEDAMQHLVASLLAQIEEGKLLDLHGNMRSQYYRLAYPGLSAQLKTYISDNSKSERVLNAAVDIAEACALEEIGPELASLALDQHAPMPLRINAAAAVMRVGNDHAKAKLKPLISDGKYTEIDDELKGAALLALWPKHISAQELFTALTPPQDRNLISLYTRLFYDDVMRYLALEDLTIALAWLEQLPSNVERDLMYQSVTDSILTKAWENIDVPGVIEPLARLLLQSSRYSSGFYYGSGSNNISIVQLIENDADTRHKLLRHLIRTFAISGGHASQIAWAPLALSRDIPWLIELLNDVEQGISVGDVGRLTGGVLGSVEIAPDKELVDNTTLRNTAVPSNTDESTKRQQVLVQLCQLILDGADRLSLNAIYEARENKYISEQFKWLLKGIDLRSAQAVQLRGFHNGQQTPPDEAPDEDDLPNEPTAILVTRLLDQFDRGETKAWWILNQVLLSESGSNHYLTKYELEPDLTRLPGWQSLNEEDKARIIQSAPAYLMRQQPMPGKWFHKDNIYGWRPAFAAFRALWLLLTQAPALLETLTVQSWHKWAPLILTYRVLNYGDGDGEVLATANHAILITLAYKHAPEGVLAALPVIINKDSKEARSLRALEHLEHVWDQRIASTLVEKLRDPKLTPYAFGEILCRLLTHNVQEAIDFVVEILTQHPLPTKGKRYETTVTAAVKLVSCAEDPHWDIVWSVVHRNEYFGKAVTERLVHEERLPTSRSTFMQHLSEAQLADLYIWLSIRYPRPEESERKKSGSRMHRVTTVDEIQWLCGSIPGRLAERGTLGAVEAIRRMMRELPSVPDLDYSLHQAKEAMRRLTWSPPEPRVLLQSLRARPARQVHADIPDAEIEDVIDGWGGPSYQAHYLEVSHLRRWLNQFPMGRPQRLMFKLLQHIRFYNEVRIIEKFKVIHSHISGELGGLHRQNKTNAGMLIAAAGNIAKSGSTYARMYRTANKLTGHNMVAVSEVPGRLANPGIKAIVLVDDIIGTGGTYIQALRTLSSDCGQEINDANIRVFATAICGLEQGCATIQSSSDETGLPVEVFVPDILMEDDRCFSSESKVFDTAEDLDEALQIVTEYGSKIQNGHPLGYEDGQLLVVFSDNCPNNSLPLLWASGRKGDEWYPLFKRIGF